MTQKTGEHAVAGRRFFASRYNVVVGLLFVAICAGLVFLAVDYELKRPRVVVGQERTMPDGTILVLERVTFGKQHQFDIAAPSRGFAPFSRTTGGTDSFGTGEDLLVFWLSRRDATTGRALDFEWWSHTAAVDEHGCEMPDEYPGRIARTATGGGQTHMGGSRPFQVSASQNSERFDQIVVHSGVRPFRHGAGTFKLRVYDAEGTVVAEFDATDPNPNGAKFPVWEPQPLPATESAGDISVTLKRLSGATGQRSDPDRKTDPINLVADYAVTKDGQPATEWTRHNVKLVEATGKTSTLWDCRFCLREPVWKLQLRLFRHADAQFDASEKWTASQVTMPAADDTARLTQSKTLNGVTIELLAAGGAGRVSHFGLTPGYKGSWGGGGGVWTGTKNIPMKLDTNSQSGAGATTVQCELPHVVARVTGVTEDHHAPDLRVTDEQGRTVKAHGPTTHADHTHFWFLEAEPDAKTFDLTFIVQKCRMVEFLVKPPKIEPTQLFQHADELARRGQWSEAAAEFTKALEVYPENHWHWYRSACLQIQLADRDGYRRQCQQMLDLFADTDDANIAERTAKICSFWHEAAANDPRLGTLTDRALDKGPGYVWFLLAKGIVELRASRLDTAVDWLTKAQHASGSNSHSTALAHLFLAVARHRLNQTDAARLSLDTAVQIIDQQLPKPGAEDLGTGWHDWLMCQIARREAEALIRGGQ